MKTDAPLRMQSSKELKYEPKKLQANLRGRQLHCEWLTMLSATSLVSSLFVPIAIPLSAPITIVCLSAAGISVVGCKYFSDQAKALSKQQADLTSQQLCNV